MLLPGQKRIEQTRVPRRNRVLKNKNTSVAYITLYIVITFIIIIIRGSKTRLRTG